jgi:hypothetical protein
MNNNFNRCLIEWDEVTGADWHEADHACRRWSGDKVEKEDPEQGNIASKHKKAAGLCECKILMEPCSYPAYFNTV